MASPPSPTSPPAAKRQKVGDDIPPALSALHSSPASKANGASASGYTNGSQSASSPVKTLAHVAAAADDDDSSDEEEEPVAPKIEEQVRTDMYLDTVSRASLDFDFEHLCSKSLSNINVYACLVCGKYFQGRGKGSWAYRHAVGENHRVWLNLSTEKFYVLPEGYQVQDPSLNDVLAVLNPRYKPEQLPSLRDLQPESYTLEKVPYTPGFIGLNNIKKNDYLNVVIQLLLHVPPVRDFFLDPNTPQLQEMARPTELVTRLAQLCRRLWSPRLFKAQASPHEFLQEVAKRSNGKFKMTEQGDPVEFLGWLVNTLHRDLGGTKKRSSSVIYKTFQGRVQIETQQIITHKDMSRPVFDLSRETNVTLSPFLFLALDLPPTPLFQDANLKKIIPQVPLSTILAKFDGTTTQEFGPTLKRHHLKALPPYLILHVKRFTKNNFVEEKNPTVVNFNMRGVDMSPYVDPKPSDPMHTVYDLISNVTIESTIASTTAGGTGVSMTNASSSGSGAGATNASGPKKGDDESGSTAWKIHVRAGRGGGDAEKWFDIQDLHVEEVRREMVFLGETVVQVWERRDLAGK